MIFDQFNFIQGQPVQGHMNILNDPFLYNTPGYPDEYPTYPHIPNTPLDLLPVNKDNLHVNIKEIKEEKKKRRRKKLLKLMILIQIMNNNN